MTLAIPNYDIAAQIGESQQAVIYKARDKRDPARPLVLKVLSAAMLSDQRKAQIGQRIEHLKVLDDPAVVTPIAFEAQGDTCFIVQPYVEGVTLDRLTAAQSPMGLTDFFAIASGLAQALDKVHGAGIIHGGIKPHNVLVDRDTATVRLIDFIRSIDVTDVSHFIYDSSFIRDALSYTSPEQTGRINHRVGFPSDMYSLGIVFYELLTGRLPFTSDDPLEVIHSHLAAEAPEVHEVNPDVPAALGRIVSKLMLKEPEKRYQSGSALLADLLRCRDEYAATGTIGEFPLESHVSAHRVTFISRMVGREQEARAILDEYELVVQGQFRSLFISGFSGIGKTRLIQELQKPIVRHRGYFTSGKFDVYQRNLPYSSLIQAFRGLMRTFLTESDARVAAWKSRILAAVGGNGRVLTDVVPELGVLIGAQPAVAALPPVESLNRFRDTFGRFLTCLASEENPLTLFIDDLQWCDAASFDFITDVFLNPADHPYLFFLGAYRHNEVDSSHPLSRLVRTVREARLHLGEIRLGPLQPEHCHEMVSYILDAPLAQTQALSAFVGDLSEGNPLFVSESLSYLHNEDLLYLDEHGQWRWDMDRIRRSQMPTTVVALFGSKIRRLSPDLVDVLDYCACLGNTFSPAQLSLIREATLLETFELLKPALGQGLLVENRGQLQFVHDKVQEAVLSAIPEDRRRRIHWQIGTHLLSAAPEHAADVEAREDVFTIVSHLNLGREEPLAGETAYLLSDLDFHAGNRALDSLATEAANEYFALARELLPDDCWQEGHYERTFRVFQKAAKTALMCGRYDDSERLLNHLLEHAKTDLDKAECLAEQTTSLSSIGDFVRAIETANRGLAYFDKAIPEEPREADRRRAELLEQIASGNADVCQTILDMPFTEDRRSKIELAFYSELIPDLYMSGLVPQLYLSAAQSTQHCLAGGMDESVIYSFSIMGLQLGEQGQFEQAFRYEDLARDLSALYPNTFGATRGMNGIVWCNMHSRRHPKQIVDYCLKAIQCGKNCGDLYNAGLSYGPLMWNLQVQGADFRAIDDYAKECLQFSKRYHLSFSVGLAEAMQAGWIAPMRGDGAQTDIEPKLKQWEQDNHIASAGSYYVHRALAHYYLGEYEAAQQYLTGVSKYLSGLTDNVLKRQWHVFLVLNALKLYEKGMGAGSKQGLLAEIRPIIEKVEAWAALGPLLKPYLAFLYAELDRVTGDFREARSLYLDAIDAAHAQGYTFLEGHLNQCLGELLRQAGHCSEGPYFVQAARLYKKCGAERKRVGLVESYPECFEEDRALLPRVETDLSASYSLPDLDVGYLMKSSLAIAAEIEQDKLLTKIMNVVVEGSGAQNGYLLIDDGGSLCVRAEGHATGSKRTGALKRPLDEAEGLCRPIVRYVYRTGEKVILGSGSQDGPFKDNPEVQSMGLRSVLCLPAMKQSRLVGVLYLDNHLADSVFTSERTVMTELLTSQAAIALENAGLVEELRQERERLLVTLRSIGDGVIATDAQEHIALMNGAAEDMTGWPEAAALGHPLSEVFQIYNELTGERAKDPVARVLATGQLQGLANHTVLVSRDGTRRVLADSAAPIKTASDTVTGVVLVFQDVTEKERLEQELAKMNKLESLGILAGGIAHDFNNLLVGILGNITLASLDVEDRREVHDMLDDAERAATRAKGLTQQLLTFAKGGEPIRRLVSLPDILQDAATFALRGSLCTPEFRFPAGTWSVEADPGQLGQVIQNLVINARDSMPDGGTVGVAIQNLRVSEADSLPLIPGDYVRVTVSDQGCGIAPDVMPRIFDPYFTTKPQGSGIGLSVVYSVVVKHDGYVTTESRPGEGSRFHVYLPAALGARRRGEAEPAAAGRPRVLVMDDEDTVLRVAERTLARLGYDAATARDGAVAVDLYRRARDGGSPFCAVILDLYVTGGVGGRETLSRLRQIDPDVRAIVCSGYSSDPVMAHYSQYGFLAALDKPFALDSLQEAIARAKAV